MVPKLTVAPFETLNLIVLLSKPIKETTISPELLSVLIEKFPSKSVVVPVLIPFKATFAPGKAP
ncbi:hypothetical protein D3C80_1868210 [compost metagenome]